MPRMLLLPLTPVTTNAAKNAPVTTNAKNATTAATLLQILTMPRMQTTAATTNAKDY